MVGHDPNHGGNLQGEPNDVEIASRSAIVPRVRRKRYLLLLCIALLAFTIATVGVHFSNEMELAAIGAIYSTQGALPRCHLFDVSQFIQTPLHGMRIVDQAATPRAKLGQMGITNGDAAAMHGLAATRAIITLDDTFDCLLTPHSSLADELFDHGGNERSGFLLGHV